MVSYIELSFRPYHETPSSEQIHNLGNIADSIWKEKMYLHGGRIHGERYIAKMFLTPDRKLRKKEQDVLSEKLKKLDSELDAIVIIKNES